MNQKQLMGRYNKEVMGASIIYTIVLLVSVTILKQYELSKFWQIAISLTPSIPVALVIISIMRLLVYSDELQQRIQLFATATSAALTGFITFSYGFLEGVGLPKFPTFLVFPMLIVIWGVSLSYFGKKYR